MTASGVVVLPEAPACVPWCEYPERHDGPNGWDSKRPHSDRVEARKSCERIFGRVGGDDGIGLHLVRVVYFESADSLVPDVCAPQIRLELDRDSLDAVDARTLAKLLREAATVIG